MCKQDIDYVRLTRSHYLERASAVDLKDSDIPKFGHSDVVFNLLKETLDPLIQFLKFFIFLGLTGPKLFVFMSKVPQIHFI